MEKLISEIQELLKSGDYGGTSDVLTIGSRMSHVSHMTWYRFLVSRMLMTVLVRPGFIC